MRFLKKRRRQGGVAFSTDDKPTWRKADKQDIVVQLMDKIQSDCTDSTAQMSDDDSVSEDVCTTTTESPTKMEDAKSLAIEQRPSWLKRPMFADICGNHAMVNAERQWGNPDLHPLKRSRELDDLARAHAQKMASASMAYHADPSDLLSKLTESPGCRLGENVAKGVSLRELHNDMKKKGSIYANMMDNRYKEFGIGTARDANGDLFLCQIYLG